MVYNAIKVRKIARIVNYLPRFMHMKTDKKRHYRIKSDLSRHRRTKTDIAPRRCRTFVVS